MEDLTLDDTKTNLQCTAILKNAISLANIVELVTSVTVNVSNKEVAGVASRDSLTRSVVANLVGKKLKARILEDSNVK